jgi:hypothetical protein
MRSQLEKSKDIEKWILQWGNSSKKGRDTFWEKMTFGYSTGKSKIEKKQIEIYKFNVFIDVF